jgi:UDPglucose 6-dehydrogenase
VVRAWLADSEYRKDWPLRQVHARILTRIADPTLAVLGLAYKENTASTRNSPSLALLAALPAVRVRAYDPSVAPRPEFHPGLEAAATPLDACTDADAVIIMTPWDEFRALHPDALAARLRGRTVIDPCGVLDHAACGAAGLDHLVLGVPPREAEP